MGDADKVSDHVPFWAELGVHGMPWPNDNVHTHTRYVEWEPWDEERG